jgi:hypothetical protein
MRMALKNLNAKAQRRQGRKEIFAYALRLRAFALKKQTSFQTKSIFSGRMPAIGELK